PRLRRPRVVGHARIGTDARRRRAVVLLVPLAVPPRGGGGRALRLRPYGGGWHFVGLYWQADGFVGGGPGGLVGGGVVGLGAGWVGSGVAAAVVGVVGRTTVVEAFACFTVEGVVEGVVSTNATRAPRTLPGKVLGLANSAVLS